MTQELKPIERAVATCVVAGHSKKDIAEMVHLSTHGVDKVYRRIFDKWQINKATDIVREWFVRRYNISRTELTETLKHPAIVGVAFFFTISLTLIALDLPTIRTARTARTIRSSRSRRGRENDFLFDPEKLTA